jgi:hypothetical protein
MERLGAGWIERSPPPSGKSWAVERLPASSVKHSVISILQEIGIGIGGLAWPVILEKNSVLLLATQILVAAAAR